MQCLRRAIKLINARRTKLKQPIAIGYVRLSESSNLPFKGKQRKDIDLANISDCNLIFYEALALNKLMWKLTLRYHDQQHKKHFHG